MAFLAKFAASKYVGDKLEDNFGPDNPRYDIIITEDGRRKKIKKKSPPGLTDHDERVLKNIRSKAWRYEWWIDCHCCCGIHLQFGTVTLWGLIPVIGDFISLLKALTLIRASRKVQGGLPGHILLVMCLWALIDFAIKLVPIVGDVLTAIIKPNTRNAARVEDFLRKRGEKMLRTAPRTAAVIDPAAAAAAGPSRRDDPRAPLLVSKQPVKQSKMGAGAGAHAAAAAQSRPVGTGPSYGTARQSTAGPGPGPGPGPAKTRTKHSRGFGHGLLPSWRKNHDSSSSSSSSSDSD